MNIHINRLSRLLAGTTVAALVVAGCGSGPATSSGSPTSAPSSAAAAHGEHNNADITFAQGMIPHHRQAVQMAGLAAGRSQNPQVLDLASRIGAGQDPEIATMTGWLQEWGADVPSDGGMMGGGHTGMAGVSGMMTPEQMDQLTKANGAGFDRMFLQMMIEHHRGAIEMAQTELAQGADPRATQLAQTIIDTQRAEITEMEKLLKQA
jgi:uncharacterized protein (DUF305 family)